MTRSEIGTAIKEIKKPTMPVPAGLGKRGRPKKVPHDPIRRYGPRFLHRYSNPQHVPDFCTPWPGFVTATTSLSEQMAYAAFAIFFGDPVEYWKPPYTGGVYWGYQTKIRGGRLLLGGQVPDYQVQYNNEAMIVRLQSMRWHVMAAHTKQVEDLMNKVETPGVIIRDIYEEDFIGDCSGRAVCAIVSQTITTGETHDPIMFGTARQVRKGSMVG
jgi:hypothetical protein